MVKKKNIATIERVVRVALGIFLIISALVRSSPAAV